MDLKLYTQTTQVNASIGANDDAKIYSTEASAMAEPAADGLEVLANKVVKYMLTGKGSDAFNPDYGSTSMHHRQIERSYIPMLRLEIMEDLRRCLAFIKATEDNDSAVRIGDIQLLSVELDQESGLTRVRISVTDTNGSYALLDLG